MTAFPSMPADDARANRSMSSIIDPETTIITLHHPPQCTSQHAQQILTAHAPTFAIESWKAATDIPPPPSLSSAGVYITMVAILFKGERAFSLKQSAIFETAYYHLQKYQFQRLSKRLTVSLIITSLSPFGPIHGLAVIKYAVDVAMDVPLQQDIATPSSSDHYAPGTSTLTNRPFATEIMPLSILLPPDLMCKPSNLVSVALRL
jgi:hypothetical protein